MPAAMPRRRTRRILRDLPTKVGETLRREYRSWQERLGDAGKDRGDEAEQRAISSGTLAINDAVRIRRAIFADLIAIGVSDAEICKRLALSRKQFETLTRECFSISNPQNLRPQFYARAMERLEKLRLQRGEYERKRSLTNSDRSVYISIIKAENDIEASMRKLLGVDAPEKKEVNEHKHIEFTLTVAGSREQLAPILEIESEFASEPSMPEMPVADIIVKALPPPEPESDEPPFPPIEEEHGD